LPQQFLTAGAVYGFQLRGEGEVLLPPVVGEQDGAPADLFIQGEGGLVRHEPLGFQLGQKQGPVGQFRQTGGLVLDDPQILLPLLLGEIRLGKQLRKALDGGDRRFEFMGIAVDEVLPQGADALQFLRHAVEILTQIVQQLMLICFQTDGIVSSRHGAKSVHQVCHIGAELMLQKPGCQDQCDPKRQVHSGEHRSGSTDRRLRWRCRGKDRDNAAAGMNS